MRLSFQGNPCRAGIYGRLARRGLLLFLILIPPFCINAAEIVISADSIFYSDTEKYAVAQGSVTITWKDNVLTARQVHYQVEKELIDATGDVTVTGANGLLRGEHVVYDMKAEHGELTEAGGFAEPWHFQAREISGSREKQVIKDARFTNCPLPNPHYIIRTNKAFIQPNKRIVIYNPVFYVGAIPVLYMPIFAQGLGPHRDDFEVKPGYNNEDGLILKSIYTHPFSDYSRIRLLLDFFSLRGWGKGIEYDYYDPSRIKGTVYGYNILEKTTGRERWTINSAYWQRWSPLWTSQAEINFLSDTNFNNIYFADNWQRSQQQLRSNLSFTRQTALDTLRIVAERTDVYNSLADAFEASSITLPRIDYSIYPVRNVLGTPFYANMALSLQNQFIGSAGTNFISGSLDGSINKDFRLARNITVVPRLGISESWQDKASVLIPRSILVTRYYSNVNLRLRPSMWMDWDVYYNYRLRSIPNSLFVEEAAADFGVENNDASIQNSITTARVIVRNSTSYSFRALRNETVADWRQHLGPLVNEVIWTPSFFVSAYIREESNLFTGDLNSVQSILNWGEPERRYINLGVFYQSARPGQLDYNAGIGFWPAKKLRIDYNARLASSSGLNEFRFSDHELKLYRDLHCWEFKMIYRKRLASEEVYLQIGLKTAAKIVRDNLYRKQENEFYPWR